MTTEINTAYFAENVATFAIVMGVAMLLIGIGFLVVMLKLVPAASTARTPAKAPTTGSQPQAQA